MKKIKNSKLGMADLKLVSYPRGLKSIKSKLGMADFELGMNDFKLGMTDFKLGLTDLKIGTYLCLFRLFYLNIRYPS
jgi:hypothetical protein